MATESYLQSYIRYACVSQASFVQVVWLRLVRCSAADVLHSFSYGLC